jgi:hypothetical protein
MEELPVLIFVGLGLSIVIAFANYQIYCSVFFEGRQTRSSSSITHKSWFRALIVPFIYFPGFNLIGLLILLYLRTMKALDIN